MAFREAAQEIKSELDLAYLFTKRWNIGGVGEWYYAVNRISRNLKVSPDIDLLRVYINEFHPEESRAIGVELKLLKLRKYSGDNWRISLDPFYQGLGQVLTYFEHGIDRAALVVGFHTDCNERPNEVKAAEQLLKTHTNFLRGVLQALFPFLIVYSLREEHLETLVPSPDWDSKRYPAFSNDAQLRRASIFKLQFVFKKSW
jgi:hypothetical protein